MGSNDATKDASCIRAFPPNKNKKIANPERLTNKYRADNNIMILHDQVQKRTKITVVRTVINNDEPSERSEDSLTTSKRKQTITVVLSVP
ncbi:hypothetical protein TNCV_2037871 [Trichonephila clavipes]|nr:hypothetical protein TNCV_2037871 [Trichonephila clavipes]